MAQKSASTLQAEARRILTSETSTAIGLLVATKTLLGEFYSWEPETLWLDFEALGIDVPVVNRVKIQAALTFFSVPCFYWDAVCFEKVSLAFNNVVPNPDALEEATSAQLAWAVLEAMQIDSRYELGPHEFLHEAVAYATTVLHREGFVVPPKQLEFCRELLLVINQKQPALVESIDAAWPTIDKEGLAGHEFTETPRDVQLARLAAVELHVREMSARVAADLAALTA